MSKLQLTVSFGDYSHTRSLKNGTFVSPRIDFEHIDVTPVTSIFLIKMLYLYLLAISFVKSLHQLLELYLGIKACQIE